jgi:hypothetical protein
MSLSSPYGKLGFKTSVMAVSTTSLTMVGSSEYYGLLIK